MGKLARVCGKNGTSMYTLENNEEKLRLSFLISQLEFFEMANEWALSCQTDKRAARISVNREGLSGQKQK